MITDIAIGFALFLVKLAALLTPNIVLPSWMMEPVVDGFGFLAFWNNFLPLFAVAKVISFFLLFYFTVSGVRVIASLISFIRGSGKLEI